MESKHLEFNELDTPNRKMSVFEVRSKHDGCFLGTVNWYGGWRQYVLETADNTDAIWSYDCLTDVANFIKELMDTRRSLWAKNKQPLPSQAEKKGE